MNKLFTITVLFALASCNNSLPSRVDVVQSGTSTTRITVSLELIDQLVGLCTDFYASADFPTLAARQHAVADCVFANMKQLGTPAAALKDQCADPGPELAEACALLGL
jgi:hypothetical protein